MSTKELSHRSSCGICATWNGHTVCPRANGSSRGQVFPSRPTSTTRSSDSSLSSTAVSIMRVLVGFATWIETIDTPWSTLLRCGTAHTISLLDRAAWPFRSIVHWRSADISRYSSVVDAAAPLRKWICSSPEDGPYVRGGSCRVLAAQSAPIFACPIGARRVEACVSFFRVRLSR